MEKDMEKVMQKAEVLIEALPYIQKFHGKIIVVKYGKTDWEIVNPLAYFEPLEADGVDDETILAMAIALMNDCDGILFAPGWKKSRGCRYEHLRARHAKGDIKYFQAEIPAEVEIAAMHWYGRHHVVTRRLAA